MKSFRSWSSILGYVQKNMHAILDSMHCVMKYEDAAGLAKFYIDSKVYIASY